MPSPHSINPVCVARHRRQFSPATPPLTIDCGVVVFSTKHRKTYPLTSFRMPLGYAPLGLSSPAPVVKSLKRNSTLFPLVGVGTPEPSKATLAVLAIVVVLVPPLLLPPLPEPGAPAGMPRLSTRFGAVPVMIAVADAPGRSVDTEPMVKLTAGPAEPAGPITDPASSLLPSLYVTMRCPALFTAMLLTIVLPAAPVAPAGTTKSRMMLLVVLAESIVTAAGEPVVTVPMEKAGVDPPVVTPDVALIVAHFTQLPLVLTLG